MTMEKEDNVFENLPANGTVVATITGEELKDFESIRLRYDALQIAPNTFQRAEVFAIIENHKKWWNKIFVKYDIPASWSISLDEITGTVYIS